MDRRQYLANSRLYCAQQYDRLKNGKQQDETVEHGPH